MTTTQEEEFVVFYWIRSEIEKNIIIINVPLSLKYLIQQFAQKCIASKILTIEQDLKLINVLIKKNIVGYIKYLHFKLLYRGSENNFECLKFHTCFNNENDDDNENLGGNITIFKTEYGNILVGYASKSWNKGHSYGWIRDDQAFLLLLQSNKHEVQSKLPMIFDIKQGHEKYALYCDYLNGPIWGRGWDIFINNHCNVKQKMGTSFTSRNTSKLFSYYNKYVDDFQLINKLTIFGGGYKPHGRFDIKEYELFSINIF